MTNTSQTRCRIEYVSTVEKDTFRFSVMFICLPISLSFSLGLSFHCAYLVHFSLIIRIERWLWWTVTNAWRIELRHVSQHHIHTMDKIPWENWFENVLKDFWPLFAVFIVHIISAHRSSIRRINIHPIIIMHFFTWT